jgi:hypothetical protein
MVRAHVKPQNQDISIHIPENYIGRELEVLLYPIDELTDAEPAVKKTIASLRGSLKLTDTEYKDLKQYLNDVRNEWEQNT